MKTFLETISVFFLEGTVRAYQLGYIFMILHFCKKKK